MSVFLRVSEGKVSILRVRVKKGVLRVYLGCGGHFQHHQSHSAGLHLRPALAQQALSLQCGTHPMWPG